MSEFQEKLKGYFVTGAKPTEQQFAELIDRGLYLDEEGNLGVGTELPSEKLEVNGSLKIVNGELLASQISHETSNNPIMGYLQGAQSTPVFAKIVTDTFLRQTREQSIPHGITNAHTQDRIHLVYPSIHLSPDTLDRTIFTRPAPIAINAISWDNNVIILGRETNDIPIDFPIRVLILFT